jgi:hypothetical protein
MGASLPLPSAVVTDGGYDYGISFQPHMQKDATNQATVRRYPHLVLLVAPQTCATVSFDYIGINYTYVADPTATVGMAIYDSGPDGTPANRVWKTSSPVTPTATGVTWYALSPALSFVPGDMYWFGYYAATTDGSPSLKGFSSTTLDEAFGWYRNNTGIGAYDKHILGCTLDGWSTSGPPATFDWSTEFAYFNDTHNVPSVMFK